LLLPRPSIHLALVASMQQLSSSPNASLHKSSFEVLLELSRLVLWRTKWTVEPIHQMLFNEQCSRQCAEGAEACEESSIGAGGWERWLFSPKVPYRKHEFGLFDVPHAYGGRLHEFSYWPSLSLNPGIWDLHEIKERLRLCKKATDQNWKIFDENDSLFEQRFSALCLASELAMGYFPAVIFSHIGNISAYDLSHQSRSSR